MDKMIELDNIKILLRSWVAEIKFNTKLDFYDINKISEGLSAKLLNAIFDYKLKDLNKIKKNFSGIDLGDDTDSKIAFQVTSRIDFQKYKEDLETFVKVDKNGKSHADTFTNGMKFLVITIEPIKTGKTELKSIYSKFDSEKDILKIEDLLPIISEVYDNDIPKFNKIKEILEKQFSSKMNKSNTELMQIFLKKYKDVILNDFSRINFFGLDLPKRPREIQLYSLFVEPKFKTHKDNPNNYINFFNENRSLFDSSSLNKFLSYRIPSFSDFKVDPIDILYSKSTLEVSYLDTFSSYFDYKHKSILYKDLFENKNNKVIIGNPGAGKSLLIKHAICKILSKDYNQFNSSFVFDMIPFRIELFKFNKDRNNHGIEHYLFNNLKALTSITDISEEFINNIFEEHKTVVFFDGLDEIFDIQERIEVRNLIENFTKKYDKSISIVTSRFESFEEVDLSASLFESYEILDFDKTQMKEYVERWYEIEENNEILRKDEIKNCLEQLAKVDTELTQSPLLLSLILILYRNELDIPTTKLEIYESCANTLIETRDSKEKKLNLNLKIKNKVSAFAQIAYWQFNLQNLEIQKKEINYTSVLSELKRYLLDQKNNAFDDDESATIAAKEFLEYAKIRSIYVENNFTHKSFLEYFTAYYLYANYYYKGIHEYIHKIISQNISKSSWSVVLELLICKIDTGQPDHDIIDKIIDEQINHNEVLAITFFTQIISHLRNISPVKEAEIISKTIDFIVNGKSDNSTVILSNLTHLLTTSRFNKVIVKQFKEILESETVENHKKYNLYLLKLEAEIYSGRMNLFGFDFKLKIKKEPYAFILECYPLLLDWNKYFEILKLFIENFGKAEVETTYSSLTKTKIFYGNTNFNWILSSLFSFNERKQFLLNYGKLKLLGFNASEITKLSKKKNIGFEISQDLLNNYYSGINDYSIRTILNNISKSRYDITCEDFLTKKNKFYGNTSKNFKFKKR